MLPLLLASLATQAPTGVPAVDSAAVARAAWREAARAPDLAATYRALSRAADAWPTQPAYVAARARYAARVGDAPALLASLRALASMEAGAAAVLADTAVSRAAAADTAIAAARSELAQRTAPRQASHAWRTIADTLFYAEGVDFDPRGERLFVASVRRRTVVEIGPDGMERNLGLSRHPGVGAILGVRWDAARGALWVTTAGLPQMSNFTPGDTAIAALLRVRVADGEIEARYQLPAESLGHTAGDLAIGPEGDLFVTDSRAPVLYRLRPGATVLERVTHPLFRSLQGVAAAPGGTVLYLADYSHGLLRLELATGAVDRLGDPPGTTSLGLDGIVWHRGTIVGVQNGVVPPRVARFMLSRDGRGIVRAEVLERALPLADEPTIGTLVGDDFVYVANSQWEKHDDAGRRRPGTPLAPTVLLRLPLARQ